MTTTIEILTFQSGFHRTETHFKFIDMNKEFGSEKKLPSTCHR